MRSKSKKVRLFSFFCWKIIEGKWLVFLRKKGDCFSFLLFVCFLCWDFFLFLIFCCFGSKVIFLFFFLFWNFENEGLYCKKQKVNKSSLNNTKQKNEKRKWKNGKMEKKRKKKEQRKRNLKKKKRWKVEKGKY